jgi:hypothetical protein
LEFTPNVRDAIEVSIKVTWWWNNNDLLLT